MQIHIPSISPSGAIRICVENECRPAWKTADLCSLAKSVPVRPVWSLIKTQASVARPDCRSKKNGQLKARPVGPGQTNEKEHTHCIRWGSPFSHGKGIGFDMTFAKLLLSLVWNYFHICWYDLTAFECSIRMCLNNSWRTVYCLLTGSIMVIRLQSTSHGLDIIRTCCFQRPLLVSLCSSMVSLHCLLTSPGMFH